MKYLYLSAFLISGFCYAQKNDSLSKSTFAFSAAAEFGEVLPTNVSLQNFVRRKNYTGYSFQFLKQTDERNNWAKSFNYPQYGVGFFAFDFLQNRQMGSPFAVYGIYNAKLMQWGKLKWFHNVNFGIAFNSAPFDEDKKYYNISLGSKTNMFISLGTGLYYEAGRHFDVGINVKFNHLSNGAQKMPNKGLNTIAPQITLVYYPERINPQTSDTAAISKNKYSTIEFSVFGGRKNVFYKGDHREDLKLYDGFNYLVYGAEIYYMRQYSPKSSLGIGAGVTMDEHYNHTMYVAYSTLYQKKRFSNDRFLFSVIPTYRLMMGRLYVNIGAGYYMLKKKRQYDDSVFFQKVGLQYQITDRLFASFGINAYNFHVANYLEWKLGYTFSKKTRR